MQSDLELVEAESLKLDKAHMMFLLNVNPIKICQALDLDPKVLEREIRLRWQKERSLNECAAITASFVDMLSVVRTNGAMCNKLINDGLSGLISDVEKGVKTLTIKDIQNLTSTLESLDKMARLEIGTPTEIVKRVGLSIEEAKRILKEDPFALGIISADSKQVPASDV